MGIKLLVDLQNTKMISLVMYEYIHVFRLTVDNSLLDSYIETHFQKYIDMFNKIQK